MLLVVALTFSLAAGQTSAKRAASPKAGDACALLTAAEIQSVLGLPITEQKPNAQPSRGLLMSQCFFGTSSAQSVSVAFAGNSAGRSRSTPREYWRRQFHVSRRDTSENGKARAEDENTPRPVTGVGEEAFWTGNRIAGALYVLQGRTFLRVSVGGIRDEAQRIEKSKALARAALKRL